MSTPPDINSEMHFFSLLVRVGSFSATARELSLSTAAVSKRLSHMESRLGVKLLHRNTRRFTLTPEGEIYLGHARRIITDIDELEHLISGATATPKGLLRVNATLGFGRTHIAPMISTFATRHPGVQIQLQLTVNPPTLTDDAFDICIRFGEPPDARVIARRIAANRRLVCAAPSYLAKHGLPRFPRDLAKHNCIGIRQGDEGYGVWRFAQRIDQSYEPIKVRGNLSTNDGEIAVNWALEGHGILMRAEWDIARHLAAGRLVHLLANYHTPPADIYAVYPVRHQASARVRAFIEHLEAHFASDARQRRER